MKSSYHFKQMQTLYLKKFLECRKA